MGVKSLHELIVTRGVSVVSSTFTRIEITTQSICDYRVLKGIYDYITALYHTLYRFLTRDKPLLAIIQRIA